VNPAPDPTDRPDPTAGLAAVRGAILAACARAGRDPASVTLIAASKTVAADGIVRAIEAEHRVFGENRVQEAKSKWPPIRDAFPAAELHLIGPLQSNKAREAVALFDAIHSVDRDSLCAALAREGDKQERRPRLLVQVNTGSEPQKAGILPGDADAFIAACRDTYGLDVVGAMCIPPVDESPVPHYTLLAKIAARNGLEYLSMGMSNDFGLAIEHGATHVRVGTAIFGRRSAA
jgi:PLP dependent protein